MQIFVFWWNLFHHLFHDNKIFSIIFEIYSWVTLAINSVWISTEKLHQVHMNSKHDCLFKWGFKILKYLLLSLQKPYACSVPGCNKRYTDPSSLRKHVKNHNQKDPQQKKKVNLDQCVYFIPFMAAENLYIY